MKLFRVALAALALANLEDRALAACQLKTIAEFHVVERGGRGYIEGAINGQPVSFLIATDATYNSLTRDAAKKLGLALKALNGYEFYGVGGRDVAQLANVHELKLDQLTLHDQDFVVTGERASTGRFGILGGNLLAQTDVEFDFAHDVIRLIDSKSCEGDQVVYWGQAYSVIPIAPSNNDLRLEFYLKLNDATVLAELSTGSATTTVTTGAAQRVNAVLTPAGTIKGLGLKEEPNFVATFGSLSVGDETIKNAKLDVADLYEASGRVPTNSHLASRIHNLPEMLLGADFVRAHHIYIARGQGKMYFSYNGGPIFQLKSAQTSAPPTSTPPGDTPAKP
jgi:hypothetical protein